MLEEMNNADIEKLFQEKKILSPVIVPHEIMKKKIKKKDIVKIDIKDLELKIYGHMLIEGVRVYDGIFPDKAPGMRENICFFDSIANPDIFTELCPSVLSAQGSFTQINFNEEKGMPFSAVPPKSFTKILKIGSNFGEIYTFPNVYMSHSLDDLIKSVINLCDENLVIGCSCQTPLDIKQIKTCITELDQCENTRELISSYFTHEALEAKGISRPKINKLVKNFRGFLNFKITDRDTIKLIYDMIDIVIPKKHLEECSAYLDKIVAILTGFTIYARKCKCWKKCEYLPIFSQVRRYTKEKKKSRRKKQGTGLYFSSQITFNIYNEINQKVNKIKLFRNGTFQVPGVKRPDMQDIIGPIKIIRDFWNQEFPDQKTEIGYILSNMRNYKCNLINQRLTILLNRLEDALYFEKDLPLCPMSCAEYQALVESLGFPQCLNMLIVKYINYSFLPISEINNNSERCPGVLIKFNRPIPSKSNKKLTIKILSSGKINFDGGNSELEVMEIYSWLRYIFTKYWDEIIYDPHQYKYEAISSDSQEYESIYSD